MWPTLILCGLAAAQVTYLVTTSVIFDGPRSWLQAKIPRVEYLITCPWCFSAWASAGTVALMHHRIDYDILAWAAVWWVACFGYWACQALASSAEM